MPLKTMVGKRRRRKFRVSVSSTHMLSTTFFLFLCSVLCCSARDTITPENRLSDDGGTLVSAGKTFELGFFSPHGSSSNGRYIGIWPYGLKNETVVWVANRNKPLPDTGVGALVIADDGNLTLVDDSRAVYWSTDLGILSSMDMVAKLMDSGNLVLSDNGSGDIRWESFKHPTDTFLPGMKMNGSLTLTSWLSPVDPSSGNYTFKLDPDKENQYIVSQNDIVPYWSSEDSDGTSDGMPEGILRLLSNTSRRNRQVRFNRSPSSSVEILSLNYSNAQLVMGSDGNIECYPNWHRGAPIWLAPGDRCSMSNACGYFGSCNANNGFMCKCLPGFEPNSRQGWSSRDFSDGCRRKSYLCGSDSDRYTFVSMKMMKVRTLGAVSSQKNESECRKECLNNCKCQAFAQKEKRGSRVTPEECLIWSHDLRSVQEQYPDVNGGYDLFVRVAISDIESTARNCKTCGTNLIPYPLSTGPTYGDPMYFSFRCDNATGQVWFELHEGSYRVTGFNPEALNFVIQVNDTYSCDVQNTQGKRTLQLHFPFHITSQCNDDAEKLSSAMPYQELHEVKISWDPPLEPLCNSSTDCKEWPNSTCSTRDGMRRCFCNENFIWNGSILNCTQGEDVIYSPSISLNLLSGVCEQLNSAPFFVVFVILASLSLQEEVI